MSTKLLELAERRSLLIGRAALQREQLSWYCRQLERPAAFLGKAVSVIRFLRSPLVAAGLSFLLVKKRRKFLGRIPGLLWKGWRLFRSVSRLRK